MKYVVKWMPTAQSDLDDIYQFYYEKSQRAAVDMWNRIVESAIPLETFACAGPLEPLLINRTKEYHSLVVEKHFKLVYYIENVNVNITAVWDIRRNPETLIDTVK